MSTSMHCPAQCKSEGDLLAEACSALQSAQAGSPLKGAAFWNFLADEQQAPAAEGGGSGLYGIKVEDSTFSFVRNNANLMSSCALSLPSISYPVTPAHHCGMSSLPHT